MTKSMCHYNIKGRLQAKYKNASVYRTLQADFKSAIGFRMQPLVYEIQAIEVANTPLKSAMLI